MNLTVFRAWSVIILLVGGIVAWQLYTSEQDPRGTHFTYGLDLVGGSHLVYEADTSRLKPEEVDDSMSALREVIERRTNLFGVSEPLVQVEKASFLSESDNTNRLIVELPNVTDLNEAVKIIGATPQLDFKLVDDTLATTTASGTDEVRYIDTGITGRYLKRARLEFRGSGQVGGYANEPLVMVDFNDEGKKLLAELTKKNVGRELAIFLDGDLKSHPVIREPITGGTAVISGDFTAAEAKELVRNLNIGALPVPITLVSTQTVGATLGAEILEKGVAAVKVGVLLVMLFMVLWYRVPGLVATLALCIYVVIMLAIFKYIPVTITAAGIAGFLLSIGMAVDANVLIFERLKEELNNGKGYIDAVREGFKRAWAPIRDGNFTSLISAVILFWFGSSIVQGFALVFGLGILVSMFTAVTVTRTFLLSLSWLAEKKPLLFKSGLST